MKIPTWGHDDAPERAEVPFRRIVETANAGIWVLGADASTMFANTKMSEILGYSAAEMANLSLFDVLDAQGKAQAAVNLKRRQEGHSAQLECAFMRCDGSRAWVLLNASPLRDDAGGYLGSVCIVSEVTDHKELEDACRQRERELSEAQRVGRLGSWEWDVRRDLISWSDEMYRLFGLERHEFDPSLDGYMAYVHPDDQAVISQAVSSALEGDDGSFEVVHRFLIRGGEIGWLHGRGEVICDESGAPLWMRGTAQDVTAAKVAEAALSDTAARYRLLQVMAEAANDAAGVDDAAQVALDEICDYAHWPAGHLLACSDGAPAVLSATPIWHLSDPERLGGLPAATDVGSGKGLAGRVLATGMPAWSTDLPGGDTHEGSGPGSGFGLRPVSCFPVVVRGRVAYILEFFSELASGPDETLVEIVAQVAAQLTRVCERQRTGEELAAARDAALESSRLKSDFVATMSHEIRTPMNGIVGLTDLLLGTDLDDAQRLYAEGVQGATDSLMAIINDILDFSKIEAGRLDIESVDFDLVEVLDEVASLVAQSAQRKGLELLAYSYPELPPILRGDPARLRQVLLNLVSNAVKFTEHGEVVLRARIEPCAGRPSGDSGSTATGGSVMVRFEVVDTGIGIVQNDRHRLFEPFSQADASTTRRFGGTGLGLAISRRLVTAMGGEIGVESQPGLGSTFWFTVPMDRPADAQRHIRPFRHLLGGRRVLVVDDNETNRLVLSRQLEAWDMRPELSTDGPSALKRLAQAAEEGRPFHVALLDMCMPDMDGLQLATRISADPELTTTCLVLLTSGAEVSASEALRAGLAARLTKPVRLSQLYDTLMRVTAPPSVPDPGALPVVETATPVAAVRGRVLVAEDNAINQMVAVGILGQLGYHAEVVANGVEALAALAAGSYEAVLMDCQMPEMDGFAATEEIRRMEGQTRHTPIIAMTAGVVEGDRERCLAAGMDDYISKPVKPGNIDDVLGRWLVSAPTPVPDSKAAVDSGGATGGGSASTGSPRL